MLDYNNWEFLGEYISNIKNLEKIIPENKNVILFFNESPKILNNIMLNPFTNQKIIKKENDIVIFVQIESSMIIDGSLMRILDNKNIYDYFDYILTWDNRLLSLEKCYKFMSLLKYSWVKFPKKAGINTYLKYHYNNITNFEYNEKKFNVSMLCGDKKWCPGHIIRHNIWDKQNEIVIPKKFYKPKETSILKVFPDNIDISSKRDKTEMFDSMFHICVENNKANNYFTEKIIDCIVSKTVPIYYGCPNIGDYFDLNGIIVVNSPEECIEKINKFTENDYYKMLPYIEKNYNIWLTMSSLEDQLCNFLKAIL
jgi:hypothetical protein